MLDTNDTLVLAIDIQEKLVNMLNNYDEIQKNCINLLKAAKILNVATLLTEQYPKGLGSTISKIKEIGDFKILEKTTFSAFSTSDIKNEILSKNIKNVVLFGIETHICIYQTALELLKNNYNVYIVSNCCASRTEYNRNSALEILKQENAKITTLEIVLFEWLKSSKHPDFKSVQALIK